MKPLHLLPLNGDQQRPKVLAPRAGPLEKNGTDHEIVVLKDTPRRLGVYCWRGSGKLLEFLGKHLQPCTA